MKKTLNLFNIFFPVVLLLFSLFLLSYVFYKSEIISSGILRDYYKTYYIIGIILLIFSIFVFFINEQNKKNIFLILFGLMLSCYLLETAMSINNIFVIKKIEKSKKIKAKIFFEKTGKKYDFRTIDQVISDSSEKLEILIQPEYFWRENDEVFPLSGIPNSKILVANENGYYSYYLSDKYGFNNSNEVWKKNKTKFLLLGDSFVHGFAVNAPNDIASQLKILSKKNVVNLGFGSNGPLTSYATLKEFFPGNVENLLWFYFEGNDLLDLLQEKKNKILNKYLDDDSYTQKLKLKENALEKVYENYKNKQLKIRENYKKRKNSFVKFFMLWHLRGKLHSLKWNLVVKKDKSLEESFKLYINILKKVISYSKNNNANFYFIYIPSDERYSNPKYVNKYYFKLKEYLKKLNINFIDLHYDLINKQEKPLQFFPFEMGGHFNEYGYKQVSKFIYNSID